MPAPGSSALTELSRSIADPEDSAQGRVAPRTLTLADAVGEGLSRPSICKSVAVGPGLRGARLSEETFGPLRSLLMVGRRVFVIRALLALASLVLALACQAQPAPATRTAETPLSTGAPVALASPSFTADQALRAVVSSSEAVAIGVPTLFPASIGSKACDLRVGLALIVPATCRTEVANGPSYYTVTFTQAWDAALFHSANDPATGQLEHSWSFTVVAGGPLAGVMAIMPMEQTGAFPPQFAK